MMIIDKQKGFTLIELVVVIAIIGVLAAIAIPSYRDQGIQTNRADGQTKLLEVQGHMERYVFDNNTYPDKLSLMSAYSLDTIDSDKGHYKISVGTPTSSCPIVSCYEITAVAQGGQASDGDLSLFSNGKKTGNW